MSRQSIVRADFEALPAAAARAHAGQVPAKPRWLAEKQPGRPERLLFIGFLVFLAQAPFWFGSNSPVSWGLNALAAGILVVGYELALFAGAKPHPVRIGRLAPEAAAFVLVVAWIAVQMSTWTPEAWHHPIWQMAAEALGTPIAGSITISPDLTFLALLRLMTAAAVFWLALQFGRDPLFAQRLVRAIAVIGVLYALYGVLSFMLTPNTILIFEKNTYLDSVTSTFINRNSYATYAGLTLIAALAVVFRDIAQAGLTGNVRVGAARVIEAASGQAGLFLIAAFIIAVALMLTGSRAGISSSLLAVAVLMTFLGVRSRKRRTIALPLLILLLLGVVAAIYSFGDTYLERLESADIEASDRLAVYALTWRSILDSPLLGFGYGTFSEIFPMYRDSTVGPWGVWDKAHNTYLELFQGLGLVGGALLVGLVLSLVGRCAIATVRRTRHATAPLVATAASFVVGVHSFADFSLQIQAVALTWTALLGIGVAQSWSSRVSAAE